MTETIEREASIGIKPIFGDKGISKIEASLLDIAQHWTQNAVETPESVALNLFNRLCDGNFSFNYPEDSRESNITEILIGNTIYIDNISIRSLYYGMLDEIKNRYRYLTEKSQYTPINPSIYDDFFSYILKAMSPVPADFMSRSQFATNSQGIFRSHFVPDRPKEGFTFKENYSFDSALSDLANISSRIHDYESPFFREFDLYNNETYKQECQILELAFCKHVYLSRQAFLHWLRLDLNTEKGCIYKWKNYNYPNIRYVDFWGDPWQGEPRCWGEDIDDSKGLILYQAFKYYSDPHLWYELEELDKRIQKNKSETRTDSDYDKLESEKKDLLAQRLFYKKQLSSMFLQHFADHHKRLYAYGYFEKTVPEPITFMQLKDMFDGEQLDIEQSLGFVGLNKVTSIRIYLPLALPQPPTDWEARYNALLVKHENRYSTHYMDLMQQAIAEFDIREDHQPTKKVLVAWFENKDPTLSKNMREYMSTIIRIKRVIPKNAIKTKGDFIISHRGNTLNHYSYTLH